MELLAKSNNYSVYLFLFHRSNAYLVKFSNGENILIDCGGKIQFYRLIRQLKHNNIKQIDYLILTHTHFDHCANAAYLKKKFNCKIIVHKQEANYLETGFSFLAVSHHPLRNKAIKMLNGKFRFFVKVPKTVADKTVDNELSFSVNNVPVKIIHTPGHSKGSITIILNGSAAFVGDNLVHIKPERIFPAFADDKYQVFTQWERYIELDIPLFYPGHGIPVQKAVIEKRIDYYKAKYPI